MTDFRDLDHDDQRLCVESALFQAFNATVDNAKKKSVAEFRRSVVDAVLEALNSDLSPAHDAEFNGNLEDLIAAGVVHIDEPQGGDLNDWAQAYWTWFQQPSRALRLALPDELDTIANILIGASGKAAYGTPEFYRRQTMRPLIRKLIIGHGSVDEYHPFLLAAFGLAAAAEDGTPLAGLRDRLRKFKHHCDDTPEAVFSTTDGDSDLEIIHAE